MPPTAILKTSPALTRVLVRRDGDDVLKAVFRPCIEGGGRAGGIRAWRALPIASGGMVAR